ncbi:MAG: DUF896 domain-containing protein [Clostridia bacterium]|nr:DUF896 domain-containing protein [Clostridia bacterium]
MTEQEIARINELARKSKAPEGLTPDERIEQSQLRRKYIDSVVGNLRGNLDSTKIQRPDGTITPLKKDKK